MRDKSTMQCILMGVCAGLAGGGFLLARVYQLKAGEGIVPDIGVLIQYAFFIGLFVGLSVPLTRDKWLPALVGACFAGVYDATMSIWHYHLTLQILRLLHKHRELFPN